MPGGSRWGGERRERLEQVNVAGQRRVARGVEHGRRVQVERSAAQIGAILAAQAHKHGAMPPAWKWAGQACCACLRPAHSTSLAQGLRASGQRAPSPASTDRAPPRRASPSAPPRRPAHRWLRGGCRRQVGTAPGLPHDEIPSFSSPAAHLARPAPYQTHPRSLLGGLVRAAPAQPGPAAQGDRPCSNRLPVPTPLQRARRMTVEMEHSGENVSAASGPIGPPCAAAAAAAPLPSATAAAFTSAASALTCVHSC